MAGSIIASCCGAHSPSLKESPDRKAYLRTILTAGVAGSVLYALLLKYSSAHALLRLPRITAVCIASELAAERTEVRGAVSFKAAWMDELGFLTGDHILDRARIEIVEV